MIERDMNVNTAKRSIDEEMKRFFGMKITKEDDAKYRCELCGKMFKAQLFVEKHMYNKHPETLQDIETRVSSSCDNHYNMNILQRQRQQ